MFEDKKITIEKVNDLLYTIRNEFENEIDWYESDYKKELTEEDINIMFEMLDRFLNKVELVIKDELED